MLASFLKRDPKNLIQRDASSNFQAQNGLLSLRSWWRSVRSLAASGRIGAHPRRAGPLSLVVGRELADHAHVRRLPMPWRPGVLLAATGTILFPVASLAQPTVPDVPKEIAVPPGHKLLFKVEGKGVQIYKAV